MNRTILPCLLVIIALMLLSTGCTAPADQQVTPVTTPPPPTAAPTKLPITTAPTAESIEPLPQELFVDLQLTKDRTNSEIHLLYNGGNGEMFTQSVRMRVTRSDSSVEEQYMADGKKPRRGDEIVIKGTRGSDRAEVYVMSAGHTYKIIDEQMVTMNI